MELILDIFLASTAGKDNEAERKRGEREQGSNMQEVHWGGIKPICLAAYGLPSYPSELNQHLSFKCSFYISVLFGYFILMLFHDSYEKWRKKTLSCQIVCLA